MNPDDEQLLVQAEVILNNFDLTSLEVDRAVKEWHEAIGVIPEGWFDNWPPSYAQAHKLSKLQDIAVTIVRGRS